MGQPVIKGALVECDRCGVQRVMLSELVLRVGIHDGRGAVRYRCDGCGMVCLRAIDREKTVSMACTAITIEWWEPSPELAEREAAGEISDADIEAWRELLADEDAFADVVASLSLFDGIG